MDPFTWLWLGWLAVFAVIEGVALLNARNGDTLSENVRDWFGTKAGTRITGWVRVRRFALVALMAWLSLHFLFDGFV